MELGCLLKFRVLQMVGTKLTEMEIVLDVLFQVTLSGEAL